MTKNLTITLPPPPSHPSATPIDCRRPTFAAPRSPYPWIWRCHKCRIVYRFSAALNRCLTCSHRFCAKCVSEFDYSGWEHWKSYWRPEHSEEECDEDEDEDKDGDEGEFEVISDGAGIVAYRGEGEQENIWEGFENITIDRHVHLDLDMDLTTLTPTSSSPTSPSSSSSSLEDPWEPPYLTTSIDDTPNPAYTTGEECEPMRDWQAPVHSGYRSVQEARKALYPGSDENYGTGEEGETMRDWPAYFSPDEISCRFLVYAGAEGCRRDGEGVEEGIHSPLVSPVGFGGFV